MSELHPYQQYAKLRAETPVSREEGGPWQVACYQDVHQVLRDHETFSSDVAVRAPDEDRPPGMLFSDPPVHNRLRKLVSRAFKPSHIAAQRGLIAAKCDQLIAEMKNQPEVDLVTSLAAPLPVTVIANMLGVADGDMNTFKKWSDAIFSNIAEFLFGQPDETAIRYADEMNHYFLGQIERLREKPVNHLLGRLVETETDEGRLTDQELLSFCSLLLIAGNETTTGLITASVRIFDELPETLSQLKEKPELIPLFIEEALRYHSPFSATIRRSTRDLEFSGAQIKKGDLVMPLMASANRDEAVFEHADRFVIDRDPNPHLAFGFGIHFCLGAHLARLEGEIAIAALVRNFDTISLVNSDQSEMSVLGGPAELMVKLEPAGRPWK